jgi:hypothetical protein
VRAFKIRRLKLKIPYEIVPQSAKPDRLFIGTESGHRFSRQFPKLGTSRPEGNLKGGRDAKGIDIKYRW